MKHLLRIFTCLIVVAALAACGNEDEPDEITATHAFNNFYAYATDTNSGEQVLSTGVGYSVVVNYTKASADVTISSLTLPGGKSYPSLKLNGLKCTADNKGWLKIEGKNIDAFTAAGVLGTTIDEFEMKILGRTFTEGYLPQVFVEYETEGCDVFSSYQTSLLFGTTKTTGPDGKVSTTQSTQYRVILDFEKKSLAISMAGAQFIPSMPAMSIDLLDVPFTFDGDEFVFDVSAITPSINSTPFPAFPISNLKGTLDPASGLEMTFDCEPSTAKGKYHVDVDCDYYPVDSNN